MLVTATAIVCSGTPWLYDQIPGIAYTEHDTLIWLGETEPTVMTYIVTGDLDALVNQQLNPGGISWHPVNRSNATATHRRALADGKYVYTSVRKARA